MNARALVDRLLETYDFPDIGEQEKMSHWDELEPSSEPDPLSATKAEIEDLLGDEVDYGKITPENAKTANTFYSRKHTYKNGVTPLQVRRNGATKTWVTRPNEFRIPVKYGLYDYFYITDKNADEWSITEPEVKPKPKVKKVVNPSSLMPPIA